jgi:hypothetical protein
MLGFPKMRLNSNLKASLTRGLKHGLISLGILGFLGSSAMAAPEICPANASRMKVDTFFRLFHGYWIMCSLRFYLEQKSIGTFLRFSQRKKAYIRTLTSASRLPAKQCVFRGQPEFCRLDGTMTKHLSVSE